MKGGQRGFGLMLLERAFFTLPDEDVVNCVIRLRQNSGARWPFFKQKCPQGQRTLPQKQIPATIIPLNAIDFPFEQVGMDLVLPLMGP